MWIDEQWRKPKRFFFFLGNAKMNGKSPRRIAAGHRPFHSNRLTVIISDDIAVGEGDDAPTILGQQSSKIGIIPIQVAPQIRLAPTPAGPICRLYVCHCLFPLKVPMPRIIPYF